MKSFFEFPASDFPGFAGDFLRQKIFSKNCIFPVDKLLYYTYNTVR